jgi:hypothetical protein
MALRSFDIEERLSLLLRERTAAEADGIMGAIMRAHGPRIAQVAISTVVQLMPRIDIPYLTDEQQDKLVHTVADKLSGMIT